MDMSKARMLRPSLLGGRRADRRNFAAQILFRKGNKRATVQLCDISLYGARVSGVYLVQPEDRFFLTLPGLAPIAARVAWVRQFEFGCEFEDPLSPVVLEAMLGR
jgi:hypothetical protein